MAPCGTAAPRKRRRSTTARACDHVDRRSTRLPSAWRTQHVHQCGDLSRRRPRHDRTAVEQVGDCSPRAVARHAARCVVAHWPVYSRMPPRPDSRSAAVRPSGGREAGLHPRSRARIPHSGYLLERAGADLRIGHACRDDGRSNACRDHHGRRHTQLDPPTMDRFAIERGQQGLHAGEAIRWPRIEPALNRLRSHPEPRGGRSARGLRASFDRRQCIRNAPGPRRCPKRRGSRNSASWRVTQKLK